MKSLPLLILAISLLPLAHHAHAQTQTPGKTTKYSVELLSKEQGAEIIGGKADDPFFAKLHAREAATMTGVPRGDKSDEESRVFARDFFRKAVIDFSDEEVAAIRKVVRQLDDKFGDRYPLLIQRPWRFIKSRGDLCGSFSFTRFDCIVISQPTIRGIVADPTQRGEALFLHEQLHVLQREQPELFASLYRDVCGFRQAPVEVSPWIDERQVTNPDGTADNWVFDVKTDDATKTYWIGTILRGEKKLHRMGRDFNTIALELQESGEGYTMADATEIKSTYTPLPESTFITSKLPLPPGYDHVNEVGAYLFTSITHGRPRQPRPLSQSAKEVLEQSKKWFEKNLAPNIDSLPDGTNE